METNCPSLSILNIFKLPEFGFLHSLFFAEFLLLEARKQVGLRLSIIDHRCIGKMAGTNTVIP